MTRSHIFPCPSYQLATYTVNSRFVDTPALYYGHMLLRTKIRSPVEEVWLEMTPAITDSRCYRHWSGGCLLQRELTVSASSIDWFALDCLSVSFVIRLTLVLVL